MRGPFSLIDTPRGVQVRVRTLLTYSLVSYFHKPSVSHPGVGQGCLHCLLFHTISIGSLLFLSYKQHTGQGVIKASYRGRNTSLSAKYISADRVINIRLCL